MKETDSFNMAYVLKTKCSYISPGKTRAATSKGTE